MLAAGSAALRQLAKRRGHPAQAGYEDDTPTLQRWNSTAGGPKGALPSRKTEAVIRIGRGFVPLPLGGGDGTVQTSDADLVQSPGLTGNHNECTGVLFLRTVCRSLRRCRQWPSSAAIPRKALRSVGSFGLDCSGSSSAPFEVRPSNDACCEVQPRDAS